MNDSNKLNGRVAIVTGGAGGIGKEICKCLIAEGAKVVMADLLDPSDIATISETHPLSCQSIKPWCNIHLRTVTS